MFYGETIIGRFVKLKSITVEDAEFSYGIRSNERNRDTVGQLADTIEEQKRFIEWQIKEPNDYYFVVYNRKNEKIGLIGIYNINGTKGEVGREVNNGSAVEAIEAEVLVHDFATYVLKLDTLCSVIYKTNKKHLKNQEKQGLKPLRTEYRNGIECLYYEQMLPRENDIRRALLERIKDGFIE